MNMDSIVIYYQKKIVRSYSPLGSCYVDIGHKAKSNKLFIFFITNFCRVNRLKSNFVKSINPTPKLGRKLLELHDGSKPTRKDKEKH